MAFGSPSQQKPYHLASSLDPAFDLPTVPKLGDDASADDIKHAESIAKERETAFQVAVETGNYSAICKPGLQPTLFLCRPIHGPAVVWLDGEIKRRRLQPPELAQLAFRMGVISVDIPGVKFETETVDGFKMIRESSLGQIYSIGRDDGDVELGPAIVFEIGGLLWSRAVQGVSPKS